MDDQATPHTYQQAAEALGIEAEAVRARLRRGALRRGPLTNDRRPTVLLRPDEIATIRASIRAQPPESDPKAAPDPGGRPDESRTIKALEGEVETLRDALGRERERADKAEAAAAVVPELRERLGRAEGESVTLREQVTVERSRAEASARELEALGAKLAAWTAGGPLARTWRAFLNRRERT